MRGAGPVAEADSRPSICSVNPPALRLQPWLKVGGSHPSGARGAPESEAHLASGNPQLAHLQYGGSGPVTPHPSQDLFQG